MPTRKRINYFFMFTIFIFFLCGNVYLLLPGKALGFTFAVMSDPQYNSESWINALTEARDMNINPGNKFNHAEFILVTGDITPIDLMYGAYKKIFKGYENAPVFLPVIGNHEFDDIGGMPGGMPPFLKPPPPDQGIPPGKDQPQIPGSPSGMSIENGDPSIIDIEFISDKIIPSIPGVVRLSNGSCSYYYDYKNVRIVSLDGYSDEIGKWGIINDKGRIWTEEAIKSAPVTIEHIFIAFHSPAFPRIRHTHDSFSADPELRNAFWNMLIAHCDKVRAVFVGHTHYYCRMRVFDPAGTAANDYSAYPYEEGGVYQINSGSTGNGPKNTFVYVEIDDTDVHFSVLEADNGGNQPFSMKEEWSISEIQYPLTQSSNLVENMSAVYEK